MVKNQKPKKRKYLIEEENNKEIKKNHKEEISECTKEVTCKGGFNIDNELNGIKHTDLVEVNMGNLDNPKVQSKSAGIDSVICYKDILSLP